jgi:rhodanese-related sulfurtransferase
VTFTPRKAALALVGAAAAYAGITLALGYSPRADVPPDLSAAPADAALDVWKAAAALVRAEGRAIVVDLRPADAHDRYHLPGARSLPGADGATVGALARGAPEVLVYAGRDDVAESIVAAARRAAPGASIHFLRDGARAWYLAFELPVTLFAEADAPRGYGEALAAAKGWLARPDAATAAAALEAVGTLATANYHPTLLKAGARPAAAGGGKRKISGGCG